MAVGFAFAWVWLVYLLLLVRDNRGVFCHSVVVESLKCFLVLLHPNCSYNYHDRLLTLPCDILIDSETGLHATLCCEQFYDCCADSYSNSSPESKHTFFTVERKPAITFWSREKIIWKRNNYCYFVNRNHSMIISSHEFVDSEITRVQTQFDKLVKEVEDASK